MNPNMCHKLVKETAEAMAAEAYDIYARNFNAWYKENRSQKTYVKQYWPRFIEQARKALTKLLKSPAMTPEQKDEIAEALILDNQVRGKRKAQIRLLN